MGSEQLVPLISSGIALLTAGLSLWWQYRVAHHKHQWDLAEQRERLMARYRDPLLHAAFELQSRLYNILKQEMFNTYVIGRQGKERDYALHHTAYLIAQYFGWSKVIRRELRFFDLGD